MARVKVEHLGQLADGANGAFSIGELVRRLVYAWVADRVSGMSFHSGAANFLHSWDGWVSLRPAGDSLPTFLSVWELSVQEDAIGKIRGDFKKSFSRALPDSSWEQSATTYVAVTLRKLQDRHALREELLETNANRWGDVQIIDGPALEQWLEKCPAVEDWCAEFLNIGGGRYGMSLSQFWKQWSTSTEPAMTREFILAGRGDLTLSELTSPKGGTHISLQFDEPSEGVAYVSAVVDAIDDELARGKIKANTLVIDEPDKALKYEQDFIAREAVPVTILMAPANRAASTLKAAGHFVISVVGRSERTNRELLRVPRALFRDLAQALQLSMGVPQDVAFRDARAAGGSVTAWATQNKLRNGTYGYVLPTWLSEGKLKATLPAVLCDAWDLSAEEDKAAIAQLAGMDFEEFKGLLAPLFHENSALLEQKDEIVYVVAPLVSFLLGAQHISDTLLPRLSQVVQKVFVDDLAVVDFATEATYFLMPYSPPRYSEWLTRGLAETILRISAFPEALKPEQFSNGIRGSQDFVDATLTPVAGRIGEPAYVAALGRFLPTFMEASPQLFLDALEKSLSVAVGEENSDWKALFQDAGLGRNSRNDYLLNGLEILACSPEYFQQSVHVIMLLSRFSKTDKGEYRTMRSLRGIFEAWSPGTSADLHTRIEVLLSLEEVHPEVTWALCRGLTPRLERSIIERVSIPMWKDFGRSSKDFVDEESIAKSYEQYVNLSLLLGDDNALRQDELLSAYPYFSLSQRQTFRTNFVTTVTTQNLPYEIRAQLAASLKRMINQHRKFVDREWTLPESEVQHLEVLRGLVAPRDLVETMLELLDELPFDYFDDDNGASKAKREDILRTHIRQLISLHGLESLLALSLRCKRTHMMLENFAAVLSRRELRKLMNLACEGPISVSSASLIAGISCRMFHLVGALWPAVVSRLAKKNEWPTEAFSACLRMLPFNEHLKSVLSGAAPEISEMFWRQRELFPKHDGDFRNESALKFIEYGRASSLLIQPLDAFSPSVALQVLNAVIVEFGDRESHLSQSMGMTQYTIEETLAWLDGCEEVPVSEIISLEYRMMPLFLGSKRQLQVHKLLTRDSAIFIEMLSHVYLPEGTPDGYVASEMERRIADCSSSVLENWQSSPGLDENGVVDTERLRAWVDSARELAADAGRSRIADYFIGKVLYRVAHVTPGEAWPPEYICSMLEDFESDDLEEGIVLQAFTSREAKSRVFGEGGRQENELAAQWIARRNRLNMKWRRARRVCSDIAEGWTSHAQSMDRFMELQRLRLSR